jgi:hypothetical protein
MIMEAFFSHSVSSVRVNGELTDWFSVNSGSEQGDIQGPPVFNYLLTSLLRRVYHVDERPSYVTTALLLPSLTRSWSLRRSIPVHGGYLETRKEIR